MRRAGSLALAVLALVGAVGTTFHTHGEGTAPDELGLTSRVPLSTITNPDSPGPAFHLHAGSIAATTPCAACVLSNVRGAAPVYAAVAPATASVPLVLTTTRVLVTLTEPRAESRSPPRCA